MHISATIRNSSSENMVSVSTENNAKDIAIPARANGQGSAVNGGELLFLSLATCFCNDIYREAAKRQMTIQSVEVIVSGHFGKEGEPASGIIYKVNVVAPDHAADEIEEMVRHVDKIAEVHTTLRKGVTVSLEI